MTIETRATWDALNEWESIPPSPPGVDPQGWYRRAGDHYLRYSFARSLVRSKRVIDFGCGFGFGAAVLADSPQSYLGVDSNLGAIQWAARTIAPRRRGVDFSGVDSASLQGLERTFDVAIMFEVIEHLARPRDALRFVTRLLRPGGRLLVSTPNGALSHGRPEMFVNPSHLREYTLRELAALIEDFAPQPRFLGERRLDGFDTLGRRVLRKPLTSPGGRETVLGQLRVRVFLAGLRRLNGPIFWRIEPIDMGTPSLSRFSSLLAIAEVPGTGLLA